MSDKMAIWQQLIGIKNSITSVMFSEAYNVWLDLLFLWGFSVERFEHFYNNTPDLPPLSWNKTF